MKLKAKKGSILFVVLIVIVMFLIVLFAAVTSSAVKQDNETISKGDIDKTFDGIHTIIIQNCNNIRMNLTSTNQVALYSEHYKNDSKLLYTTKLDTLFLQADTASDMNSISYKNYSDIKLNIPSSINNIHVIGSNIDFYSTIDTKSNEEINWYLSQSTSWELGYNYDANSTKNQIYYLNKHHFYADFSTIRITYFDYFINEFILDIKNKSEIYENLGDDILVDPFNRIDVKADSTCKFNVNSIFLKKAKIEFID